MSQLVHEDITEKILGAAFEVHSSLGPGFLESIYEEALSLELHMRGLAVQRQVHTPIHYKQAQVGSHKLDMVVNGQVIVELKAITEFAEVHKAIALSYLAATGLSVALLLNFGQSRLQHKRVVRTRHAG